MDWHQRFLTALKESRPAYDEKPDWRAGLVLYDGLSTEEQNNLDRILLSMIDEEYRNPCSLHENLPFDDVMVNLPAGMVPDDLVCIEGAVLVAAERGLGEAFFAINRLMRSPRWHALSPRLYWLNYEGFAAQKKLAATRAGRYLGTLLGLALGDSLRPGPDGPVPRQWGAVTEAALALSLEAPRLGIQAVLPATHRGALSALLDGAAKESSGVKAPAFRESATLEECLVRAVNLGEGEAAVCGALAGALYGPLAIPRHWSTALRDRNRLEAAAEAFFTASRP